MAQRNGWFEDEITPISVKLKDKEGKESDVTLTQDDVRWGTTYEGISKLPPSFKEFGDKSHAGNSSQVTDGAAALVLMKRTKAAELGQPVLAKYVGTALSGVAPRIMVSGRSWPARLWLTFDPGYWPSVGYTKATQELRSVHERYRRRRD